MQGKCHELIGLLYFYYYNQDKALTHSRQAAEYYTKAGKDLFALYSYFQVVAGLSNSKKYKESLALLDSLAPQIQDKDDYTKAVFYTRHLWPLSHLGRGEAALDTLRKLQAIIPVPSGEDIYDYGDVARVYLFAGMADSAEFYLNKYCTAPNPLFSEIVANALARRIAESKGDYKQAYFSAVEEKLSDDRKSQNDYLNSLAFAERDYYIKKENSAKERANERNQHLLLLSIFTVVLFSSAVALFIIWRRRKRRKLDEMMVVARQYFDKYEQLTHTTDLLRKETSDLREEKALIKKELELLYRRQFESLNHLSKIYFESPSASDKGKLLKDIGELMKEVNTPLFRENVLRTVNALYGNIIETLENSVDKITEREVLFYAFMVASLSPEAICLILGLSKTNYYTLRSRVQNKILDSGSENVSRLLDPLK